jgi:transcriptional regulator with PAS, ATPase and Fis domain
MIEIIKDKIWSLLKEKEVSLAMIFDKNGKIAWSKGRQITGRTIQEGEGFSKTYIEKSLKNNEPVKVGTVMLSTKNRVSSTSMTVLRIRSLLILPIEDPFILYIDSGTKDAFSQLDFENFKILGELLGDTINLIKKNQGDSGGITGSSEKIQFVRSRAAEYSLIDEPVLLKGETGTGKNYIAELIHRYSGKPGKFKVINTPGIPENLFESEMFGHKKGAFTDAKCDRKGLIQEAEGGTLFIDEITEVPVSIQAKLLRFVDTKTYTVLGESREKTADVRIMAATNKDIGKAIKNKEFREDLYYRLNVLEIELPPLRERKQDLKDLVLENKKHLNGKKIGKGFREALYHHDWPGNIRELITVLKRAGLIDKETIEGRDIQQLINTSCPKKDFHDTSDNLNTIWNEIKSGKSFWEVVKAPFLDREIKRSEVKEIIKWGLQETGGKYKGLLKLFNLEEKEYKNFMRFLYDNRLKS